MKRNEFRRVSVAAERYNPEDDDDSDGEQAVVYSKTPEQRQRLKDAVCHNLLFRTLEAKQIDQILDAMWEKHVEQNETIIRQGSHTPHVRRTVMIVSVCVRSFSRRRWRPFLCHR